MTMANYYGSLAATRCLGAHEVPVIVADGHRFAPARWSKHVVRREACPPPRPVGAFMDWMLAFGERHPGNVLYATSDDLAWAFAERQTELSERFRLLSPPLASIRSVLDKAALHAACMQAGLRPPRTWFPRDDAEVAAVGRQARFPIIIKPRTQVRFRSMAKGRIVVSPDALLDLYRLFLRDNEYDPEFVADNPGLERPMLQELEEGEFIYAISGFCDPRRGLFVARGSRKLVQWPRRAGIGIVFEDAPVDEELSSGLRRLSEITGFFGVFEAEFVGSDRPYLIDYNPRFFGQMGFDAARGLPSPYLVYLSALGADRRLSDEIESARRWRPSRPMVYVNRTALAWTSAAERVVGRKPAKLPQRLARGVADYVDAVGVESDWLPAVVDGVGQVLGALRHPRAALRAAFRGH
jgi:predicted ATP-grasp superfamily ATP-dependent carboligase